MEKMQGLETLEAEVTRLTLMAGNLEETLAAMEQRLADNSGQVDRMTATIEVVEPQKVEALETRLAEAERQIAVLQANAAALEASGSNHGATQPGRKTVGAFATQLLAKHGVNDAGSTDLATVDAALTSLPIEQRIAVKSQLLRAGLLG
jgi:TolA-binding protein